MAAAAAVMADSARSRLVTIEQATASSASVPANSSPQRDGSAAPRKMPSMLSDCQNTQLVTLPPHR